MERSSHLKGIRRADNPLVDMEIEVPIIDSISKRRLRHRLCEAVGQVIIAAEKSNIRNDSIVVCFSCRSDIEQVALLRCAIAFGDNIKHTLAVCQKLNWDRLTDNVLHILREGDGSIKPICKGDDFS